MGDCCLPSFRAVLTLSIFFAGVPRLFDLVRVREERLKTAFFYALGNTLVAQNLEQASRIAYGPDKRWSRVVTLQVLSGSLYSQLLLSSKRAGLHQTAVTSPKAQPACIYCFEPVESGCVMAIAALLHRHTRLHSSYWCLYPANLDSACQFKHECLTS